MRLLSILPLALAVAAGLIAIAPAQAAIAAVATGSATQVAEQSASQSEGQSAGQATNQSDNRLTRFVAKLKTISADFVQAQENSRGATPKQSSGHFVLSRPGQFNWVYKKPYVQRLVSSNGILWIYDPDLEQVTRSKLSNAKGAPISILLGTKPLASVFDITHLGEEKQGGLDWFRLTPKGKQGDFNQVLIGMDEQGIKTMEFIDALKNVTRITFSNRRLNQSVDSSQFDFKPPAGVDVVEAQGRP